MKKTGAFLDACGILYTEKQLLNLESLRKKQRLDLEIPTTFQDLPCEAILKIFAFLNLKSLFQCMAVNKKFRVIANDKSLWNKIYLFGDPPFGIQLNQIMD